MNSPETNSFTLKTLHNQIWSGQKVFSGNEGDPNPSWSHHYQFVMKLTGYPSHEF